MTKNDQKEKRTYTNGTAALIGLAVLLVLAFAAALCLGSAGLTPAQVFVGLLGKGKDTEQIIVRAIRLPRAAAGMLAGVGLSAAGVLLQTVTNNPLASPNVIGVNAGAGFAVMLCLSLFPALWAVLPAAAFCGAFLVTLLIVAISRRSGHARETIVLAGVAITAVLNAGISLLSLLYPDVYASYNYFSIGGLAGTELSDLAVPAVIIFACFAAAGAAAGRLNLLCLGDSMAASLGVRVRPLRMFCLVLASASAASVVTFAGLIGFVGLVVPHIVRRLVGSDIRWLLPASALFGASLVMLSDTFGRVIAAPSEIPVGIIMAFIGAPFFFWLLLKRRGGPAC